MPGVADRRADDAVPAASTIDSPATRPWRTRSRPENTLTLTLTQTIGWIAMIAIGSLLVVALATVIGNGLPPLPKP